MTDRWASARRAARLREESVPAGQGSLLDGPATTVHPIAARALDGDTAVAAAISSAVGRASRSRLKGDILRLIQLAEPEGLTDDVLDQYLVDDDRATIARRRRDLVDEGLVVDSGDRRPTRRGRPAVVWIVAR